jgi:hypothetical protein
MMRKNKELRRRKRREKECMISRENVLRKNILGDETS